MANRETTYYSLLSRENLRHIEQTADTMDEQSFVTLGFEKKWFCHLWIGANNEAFLEYISHQTDLTKLDMIIGEQLKLYARKQGEGYEEDKGGFYGTYKARKDWLSHTIFICKNQYNKTQNEVFNEVVKWCVDWQNEWLETFNPYSPNERTEMIKDLKTPLWEQLNESEPPQQPEKSKSAPAPFETKPTIDSETIDDLFKILKGYFKEEQHSELKTTLQIGNDTEQKLCFKAAGNKLADTFRQLFDAKLLTGCQKKDLQKWIVDNFQFLKKGIPTDFKDKTVEKSISGNEYPCKNPIIKIENGKIFRA